MHTSSLACKKGIRQSDLEEYGDQFSVILTLVLYITDTCSISQRAPTIPNKQQEVKETRSWTTKQINGAGEKTKNKK